jgi:hypothetical protein
LRTNRRADVALLVLVATAIPLRAVEPAASAQTSSPANLTQAAPPTTPRWETLARSITGQPIEFAQIGQGERHVLVVGPLAGDQPEAAAFADQLAAHLVRFPRWLAGTTVTIVRDPNPDGRARRTPGNAHSVLLDRNFRTKDWRKVPAGDQLASGREPQSEAETRALADLMADIQPQSIVLLSATPGRPRIDFCGPAEELARAVGVAGRLPVAPLSRPASGSLMTYAGVDRGIATLRFTVSARSKPHVNWSAYKRALLLAIGCAPQDDELAEAKAAGVAANSAASASSGPLVPVTRAATARASGETASPVAQGHDAEPRKSTAQAIPVHPVSQATRAASPRGTPRLLRFEDFQRGLELIPVSRPQPALPPPPQPKSPPHSSPTPAVRAPGSAAEMPATLRRLPPVDRIAPAAQISRRSRLPQEPIPLYPETGYN